MIFSCLDNTNAQSNIEPSLQQNKSCTHCRSCLYLDAVGHNVAGFYHAYALNNVTYHYDGDVKYAICMGICRCHCHKQ